MFEGDRPVVLPEVPWFVFVQFLVIRSTVCTFGDNVSEATL